MQHAMNAIILAGGAGSRLGGADKAAVELDGAPLIARAFAASAGATRRALVGGTSAAVPSDVHQLREDPPGSGPAAALVAGLNWLQALPDWAEWTLILGCDLPGAREAARRLDDHLARALREGRSPDGVVLADPDGRPDWVCSIWRTEALFAAAEQFGSPINRGLKSMLHQLDFETAAPQGEEWRDVDTWDDHAHWSQLLAKAAGGVMPESVIERAQWEAWIHKASSALDIDPELIDVTLIHELSKDVAHNVVRPLAPVSTYLLGVAVGVRLAQGEAVDEAARRELAERIPSSPADKPQIADGH